MNLQINKDIYQVRNNSSQSVANLNVDIPDFPTFSTLQDFKITWDKQMELKSNSCFIHNGKYRDDFGTREVVV